MRLIRFAASALVALSLWVSAVRADTPKTQTPPSPRHLLPNQADLLVEVAQPRRLVETLAALDVYRQIQQLAPVRELLDSTNVRRFAQLVAYFEKELGAPWPQLLERLAGRGAVLGIKFGPNPAPSLLIVQGTDEKLMAKFFRLGVMVLEQELARQEAKEKPVKGTYEGIETVRVGTEFHAAVAGSTLLLSNNEEALRAGLDRHLGRDKKSMAEVPGVAEAAKLLPHDPLVSAWLNMEKVRQSPEAKAVYKSPPRDDPNLTVLFGHYLDLLGRSPFVCAGIYRGEDGFTTTIRMPRGRDGMGADRLLHVPPAGQAGSRPLLEPKNVVYSESNYLDISAIWKDRAKLFNEKQVQALEKFDKQATPFMAGAKVSKLLTQAGPYYRFVAAHQPKVGYKTTPKISIPAFALVWELREPEAFAKSMETVLRGAALLAGAQADLKLVEEKYKDCKLIGYRFPEDKPLKGDVNDLRFNFSPCFTRVGDQYVVCSTIELCRELVELLQKEGTTPTRGDASPARVRLYATGGAAYLQTIEDLLVTQATLDQALTPKEARDQVKTFLELVRQLGALSLGSRFDDKSFRYDIRLRSEK
ncbi:MAG TPA: hypothetical protein VH643_16145 [Gemmataceae bacterium]|jgi:hypothetical protein